MPRKKNKTRKIRKDEKTLIGFDNIPKTMKTIWAIDQFGKRKVIDIEKYIIRHHIDSMGLATDYKKDTERYNFASTEIKRRLIHQLKEAPSSRRLYRKKTRKKYSKKNIDKEIDRMPIKKAEKLYFEILEKHKPSKSSKK
tara:strand:+ start:2122 stop:2541 length:420 start_codon:yes stop_codon:yes gene_type:complete